jgi:hypothetical protein
MEDIVGFLLSFSFPDPFIATGVFMGLIRPAAWNVTFRPAFKKCDMLQEFGF